MKDFWRGMGDHSVFRENEERSVVANRGLNESGWDEWGSLELLFWKLSRLSSHAPVVNVWRASASIRYRRAHPSLWDGKSFNWNVGWNLPASSCWSGAKAGLCRNVGCGPSLRSWGLGHAGLFCNKNCHPLFAPHIYDPQDFTLIDPLPFPKKYFSPLPHFGSAR